VSDVDIENYMREARKLSSLISTDSTTIKWCGCGSAAYMRQVDRCNMYWEALTVEERARVNNQL
jgi:hypothetical protein